MSKQSHKTPQMTIYQNGIAIVRSHNKRVVVEKTKIGFWIEILNAGFKDPSRPSCEHKTIRGKLHNTTIHITPETMEYIIGCYIEIMKQENDRP